MIKSRNQREGYYAGWRRLMALSGHCRTGLPTESNDYFPPLDPLPRKRGKLRKEFAVNVMFRRVRYGGAVK
jgi:hypothetical protein